MEEGDRIGRDLPRLVHKTGEQDLCVGENKMFSSSADFYLVIRTLWWSCQPEKNKFGPKRSILEEDFPDLCPYYDNCIYQNRIVNNLLSNPDYFLNRPMVTFLKDSNMTLTIVDLENFKQDILKYYRKNLVNSR